MSDAEPILAVRNVSKAFGAVQALKGVSFDVHPGEVVALAGDNGAGKSTLIKAISGVFQHDFGRDPARWRADQLRHAPGGA